VLQNGFTPHFDHGLWKLVGQLAHSRAAPGRKQHGFIDFRHKL
jgi:hypothetical protein